MRATPCGEPRFGGAFSFLEVPLWPEVPTLRLDVEIGGSCSFQGESSRRPSVRLPSGEAERTVPGRRDRAQPETEPRRYQPVTRSSAIAGRCRWRTAP